MESPFKTHYKAYNVFGHLDDTSNAKDDKYEAWHNLDSIVGMWIYGTFTQPLLTMVLKIAINIRTYQKLLKICVEITKMRGKLSLKTICVIWFLVIDLLWSIVKR